MRSFFGMRRRREEDLGSIDELNDQDPSSEGAVSTTTALEKDDAEMSVEEKAAMFDRHARAAERLSIRLMAVDGDERKENDILRDALGISAHALLRKVSSSMDETDSSPSKRKRRASVYATSGTLLSLILITLGILAGSCLLLFIGIKFVGPPNQPVGTYKLVERQEGMDFFSYYTFYEGRDSAGSNGYNMYISEQRALQLGVVNVSMEKDVLDVYEVEIAGRRRSLEAKEEQQQEHEQFSNTTAATYKDDDDAIATIQQEEQDLINSIPTLKEEPFVYMMSAPTGSGGPREAVRLEGKRRFNRGLFIIDLRHMPAGCGVWPAFWLTDEANWPVHGEIDIVEGVNYQSVAKTALHTTKGCHMYEVPAVGLKTGSWDEAVGIPDKETGIPDMTMRYAQDCFVYNPHQWLNQGCVAVDSQNGTLGVPLNKKGGGVYVLEWDPIFRRIRSWVFTPHTKVPENLRRTIQTARNEDPKQRVDPDPDEWPLPYGYFAIGDQTDCPSYHFKNMRLVFNLAFCGSVAGNRFHLDCKRQAKVFDTCKQYVATDPEELKEAYWKVRGVYVYEREWERAWL